ncbi:hypothetical protein B0H19DRAFT_1272143 [Mycena capillaripes]|nr:hypothetical protein B0H19DRAFT_1272143 [Mycena capillaripes]
MAIEKEGSQPVSDNERLVSSLQSCFRELIKKQEEQADKIHRAVEALKPRESLDKKTAFWESYMKLADEHDKEFQKKYSTDLDTALIFAGLFSAVGSAFIIQIQPELRADPPSIIVIAQSLLYISLFTTLLAALLAVLGKQWVMYYEAAGSRGSIEERGLERQRKLDGLRRWKFDVILQSFSLLLQLALFLFLAALSIYLRTVHHTIAVIVLALACAAFAAYAFLLASAIVSPDSPFQNPLAALLLWVTRLPLKPIIICACRQLWSRVRSTVYFLCKASRQILTCFASNPPTALLIWATRLPLKKIIICSCRRFWSRVVSTAYLLSKEPRQILPCFASNASDQPRSLYCDDDFMAPSPEIPAVLWVLETSTDHRMIEVAGEMAAGLQWPLTIDLWPQMDRFEETFNSCFEVDSNGLRTVRPGMIQRAINCGRAYCSLNIIVAAYRLHPSMEQLSATQPQDPQFLPLLDVITVCRGDTGIMGHWEDSFAVQWALHCMIFQGRRSLVFGTLEIESQLDRFLDQFPSHEMPSLDRPSFANYLCCINSMLAPMESRVLSQFDKSFLRESLITHLFQLLETADIDSHLIARVIHTTAQLLEKSVGQQYITNRRTIFSGLVASAAQFCRSFTGVEGWLDVAVSAAKLARVDNHKKWMNLYGHSTQSNFIEANTHNVQWIYRALEHVQQLWKDGRSDTEDYRAWDSRTAEGVDGLLQILASNGPLPDKPPLSVFDIVLRALSAESTYRPAFLVFFHSRSWFLDLISPGVKTSFSTQLEKSLMRAVTDARKAVTAAGKVLAQTPESNVSPDKRAQERLALLLEALSQKSGDESQGESGTVQLGGSVTKYNRSWQLLKLFEDEIKAVRKLLDPEFGSTGAVEQKY